VAAHASGHLCERQCAPGMAERAKVRSSAAPGQAAVTSMATNTAAAMLATAAKVPAKAASTVWRLVGGGRRRLDSRLKPDESRVEVYAQCIRLNPRRRQLRVDRCDTIAKHPELIHAHRRAWQ